MDIYNISIYFGHKAKINMFVTESIKNRIQNAVVPITLPYASYLNDGTAAIESEMTIKPDFIQFISAKKVVLETEENRRPSGRDHKDLKNYNIAHVRIYEY